MRRIVALFVLAALFTACGGASETADTALVTTDTSYISEDTILSEAEENAEVGQYIMLTGLLYENTGIISDVPRCGMFDGSFSEIVPENELPRKNGQANINGIQGWQFGSEPLTVEVRLTDGWYVFAEADIPYERDMDMEFGLTSSVENVTSTGLTLCFVQSGGTGFEDLSADPAYYIQRKTDNGWELCGTVTDNYGWKLVGETIAIGGETRLDIDWEWLYGKLPAGDYRISKVITPYERFCDGCTFRTEFTVEEQ